MCIYKQLTVPKIKHITQHGFFASANQNQFIDDVFQRQHESQRRPDIPQSND
jgi:hypothetical protein